MHTADIAFLSAADLGRLIAQKVALKISHAVDAATGSRCTRYPRCSIRRVR